RQGSLPLPAREKAVREIEGGCEVTILCNQRGSPWPDLVRPPTSSVRRCRLAQDVDARDEPGHGALASKIWGKTPTRAAPQFSPDSPARKRESRDFSHLPPVHARGRL